MDFDLPIRIVTNLGANAVLKASQDESTGIVSYVELCIDRKMMEYYPQHCLEGLIKHELCHWALSLQGKPNNDDDAEFIEEMKRVGGLWPNDIPLIGFYPVAVCEKCGKVMGAAGTEEQCKKSVEGLFSPCCKAPLVYGGKRFVNMLKIIEEYKKTYGEIEIS